eukprot:2289620-Rhodomonas_salina.3
MLWYSGSTQSSIGPPSTSFPFAFSFAGADFAFGSGSTKPAACADASEGAAGGGVLGAGSLLSCDGGIGNGAAAGSSTSFCAGRIWTGWVDATGVGGYCLGKAGLMSPVEVCRTSGWFAGGTRPV